MLDLIAKTLLEEETLTNEQIMNLVNYGKVDAPVKETLDEKPSTEVSEQSEVVDSMSHVPNAETIEIDAETMITTPTDEAEGPVKVEDGTDQDPVSEKDTDK